MSYSNTVAVNEVARRDPADAEQNAQILARATEILEGAALDAIAANRTRLVDPEFVRTADPFELEAIRAAIGKLRLRSCRAAVHVSVIWPVTSAADAEPGREKARQLEWLFEPAGLDHTFELVPCEVEAPGTAATGAAIAAAMRTAMDAVGESQASGGEHVVLVTESGPEINLAQAGTLLHAILETGFAGAVGQRFGLPGAVLVSGDGATTAPDSTGERRDRDSLLFRHFVRARLLPSLEHVYDVPLGIKAFRANVMRDVLPEMQLFDEMFDVELLHRVEELVPVHSFALVPILSVGGIETMAADSSEAELQRVKQIVRAYDACVGSRRGIPDETAQLLELCRYMRLELYRDIMAAVSADAARNKTELFERRFDVQALMQLR